MCLSLAACGNTESDDTQSGYETVMDMEFLDGMWSIDGTAKLYFDSTEGFYAYRTGSEMCIRDRDSAGAENSNCPRRAVGR
mgnify:CR=1 FL=1